MRTTAAEAKAQTIFVIIPTGTTKSRSYTIGKREFFQHDFKQTGFTIEKTNLLDLVMSSAEETTSPRGVAKKLHIREKEQTCSCWNEEEDTFDPDCKKCDKGHEVVYQLWTWGISGNNPKLIETYDTETEAEDELFNKTYEYDFINGTDVDTSYYETIEEAFQQALEHFAERSGKSIACIVRYMKFVEFCNDLYAARAEKVALEYKKEVETLSDHYATMLEPEQESYKQTADRLSAVIGEKIDGKVFHATVKKIRAKKLF